MQQNCNAKTRNRIMIRQSKQRGKVLFDCVLINNNHDRVWQSRTTTKSRNTTMQHLTLKCWESTGDVRRKLELLTKRKGHMMKNTVSNVPTLQASYSMYKTC